MNTINTAEKPEKRTKGNDLMSQHPFAYGRYYLLNIVIYSLITMLVLAWHPLFESVSYWWILCLVPLFLNRFRYILSGMLLLSVIVLSVYWSEVSSVYLILFPAALYLGHLSAAVIHNAVHNSFKPVWLNNVIGELCALQQLSAGYPVFKLVHYEHHIYPDDPEKDPHPSLGYTFWGYVDAGRSLVQKRLTAIYLEKWGDSEASRKSWRMQEGLLLCARFVKTFFWFCLLGPKFFVLLFVPSYVSYVYLFSSFNYFTHREKADGSIEILNLDNNWYYRFCNKTLFGVFYHKNHHLKPRLFNPMHMEEEGNKKA
ncbi:MAG: fatty acid desaturase [Methylococcaceae bacterium]|jgi:fatty acid desaturase